MFTYFKEKHRTFSSNEIGLEVNADKTNYSSCLKIRMHDEVTIYRLIIVPLKVWNSSNILDNRNISKFYSGRN